MRIPVLGIEIKRADAPPISESINPQALPQELQAQLLELEELKRNRPGRIAESNLPTEIYFDPNFLPAYGGVGLGLTPMHYFRTNAQAEKLSQSNGFYYRCIEIATDHVCGTGLKIEIDAEDEKLKDIVESANQLAKDHFFGDINQVDMRYEQWVFEGLLSGMLCQSALVDAAKGEIEYGDIPASWLIDMSINPMNANDVLAVKTHPSSWIFKNKPILVNGKTRAIAGMERESHGNENSLRVIRVDRDTWLRDKDGKVLHENDIPLANPNFGKLAGDAFMFRLGHLRGQKFGQGIGFHIHELVTEIEHLIFIFRRAYEIQLNIIAWIKIKGNPSQEKIDAQAQMIMPTAPFPFVSDENIELQLLSPDLKPSDLTELVKTLARYVSGIMGLAEFATGDGTNTNVATAEQQTPIMEKRFKKLRSRFERWFAFMIRYYLQVANEASLFTSKETGVAVRLTKEELKKLRVRVTFPQNEQDLAQRSRAVKDLTEALIDMLNVKVNGQLIIDVKSMMDAWTQQLAQAGIHINQEALEASRTTVSGTSGTGAAINMQDLNR